MARSAYRCIAVEAVRWLESALHVFRLTTFTFRKAGDVCYTPPLGEAMVEASLGAGAGVGENFRFSSIAHSWRLTPGQSFRKTTLGFWNECFPRLCYVDKSFRCQGLGISRKDGKLYLPVDFHISSGSFFRWRQCSRIICRNPTLRLDGRECVGLPT